MLGKEEVIAHVVENNKFGLVILFLDTKIDITKDIEIYSFPEMKVVLDQDLLGLILSPFPKLDIRK